jgi:hypothetical protein
MRITIAVHGHLRQSSGLGQEEMTFVLPDVGGMRIRDLLTSVNMFEEEVKEIHMDGRKARLDTILRGRAKLDFYGKRQ